MSDMVLLHQVNSEENLTLVVYSSALAMELLQSSAKAFDVMFLRSSSLHNGGLYSVFLLTQAPPPTLPPTHIEAGKNGHHFTDDTFKRIFLNENVRMSIKNFTEVCS